jgi:hypothetical protein
MEKRRQKQGRNKIFERKWQQTNIQRDVQI